MSNLNRPKERIYTDDSGLLADADLKYFGVAAGSGNGQAWDSLKFDRLKVSDVVEAPARCGDPNHPYPIGDLNRDCYVDLNDFTQLAAQWFLGCSGPYWCDEADLDTSGFVGFEDLDTFTENWLDCSNPVAPCNFNP